MARYRCGECGVEAEIDKENRTVVIHYRPEPSLVAVSIPPASIHFPLHPDCELAKPVGEIDVSKLERVS